MNLLHRADTSIVIIHTEVRKHTAGLKRRGKKAGIIISKSRGPEYLDLEVIRANPKVFLGYSDTTISHLVCYKAGLVSFYGPSIMAGFAENGATSGFVQPSSVSFVCMITLNPPTETPK